MPQRSETAQDRDLRVLGWLAECQRNRFLAVPLPDVVRQHFDASGEEWTRGICHLDVPLTYEPRSIAVSPKGRKIAVGTKAGDVHLAEWTGQSWSMGTPLQVAGFPGRRPGQSQGRAVRGLCFLGENLLIAGGGPGRITVLRLHAAGADRMGPYTSRQQSDRQDPWLLRFARILPLFPGENVPERDGAPLALGVTPGQYLHLLRRRGGGFEVDCCHPRDLFGSKSDAWEKAWIIDGEWWQERLWLLDSRGGVHRFRQRGEGPLGLQPDTADMPHRFEIPYFRARRDPRSLSLCEGGLAVRFGDDVTVVRFQDVEDAGDGTGRVPRERIDWVEVPGLLRCLALQEFGTSDTAHLALSTSGAGLQWVRWRLRLEERDRDTAEALPGQRLRALGGADDSVLEMALVKPAPHGTYLVQCTRKQRMRICSLLDKEIVLSHVAGGDRPRLTEKPLSAILESLLRTGGKAGADARRRFLAQAQPGVALRAVRHLVAGELWAACRGEPEPPDRIGDGDLEVREAQIAALLEKLNLTDLQDVLEHLRSSWIRAAGEGKGRPEGTGRSDLPASVYRRFCLRVFQRAARLDEGSLRDMARLVGQHVEDLRRHLPADEWRHLGLFGGFLRKWFVYGYTYGENRLELLQLSEKNRGCGRDLDAIFYLTRLLRDRVDASWERKVEPTEISAGIWDLASPADGRFFLHSHTDGRLFATTDTGQPVAWDWLRESPEQAGRLEKVLNECLIALVDGGLALCHRDAEEFRTVYRHGPYMRSVYIDELKPSRYLVFFGMRGWYRTDREMGETAHAPRLVALEVEWRPSSKAPLLVIREAAFNIQDAELYGIACLQKPDKTPEGPRDFVIGTGGSLESPFLEARIAWGPQEGVRDETATALLRLTVKVPSLKEDPRWRSFDMPGDEEARSRLRVNLAWAVDTVTIPGKGGDSPSLWLWIGMYDGRLRAFLRDGDLWREGGRWGVSESRQVERPLLDPILTHSPVWTLRCLESPVGAAKLLAYGTAEGVLGVVPLDRLAEAARQAPETLPLPTESNLPWSHLVHSRQRSAICGVADYLDGKDWSCAFLSEKGRVAIYHLGSQGEHREETRFIHSGLRVDHFNLPSPAWALKASVATEEAWGILRRDGEEDVTEPRLPSLIVGGNDGTVTRYLLLFPKYSERRNHRAIPRVRELYRLQSRRSENEDKDDPYPVRAVGEGNVSAWLRLFAVGERNLARFSLWYTLQGLHEAHLPHRGELGVLPADRIPDGLSELADEYTRVLRRLTDEVYGRKPFGTDAAKILWSETARYANKLAEISLAAPDQGRREEALRIFNRLLLEMDHLANRWIGADQAAEARVLMHSFSDLFEWSGIVLIAQSEWSPDLEETRKLLLFKVIRRRLRHNDHLVPLEALRVINTAILRAIINQRRWRAGWTFVHRPDRAGDTHGFHNLLSLVGSMARQQGGRLTPASPLFTEIVQFFALSLLLVPGGTLVVGQAVGETRLTEHGTAVDRWVIEHARRLQAELAADFDLGKDGEEQLTQAIKHFQDYLFDKIDFEIDRHPMAHQFERNAKHPWRRLLSEPEDQHAPPLTDLHFRAELRQVLYTVARLARLSPGEAEPLARGWPGDEEVFQWLSASAPRPTYFRASQRYLRHLERRWRELSPLLREPQPEQIGRLFQLCDQELRDLDDQPDLVEPQKTHFRQILERWRRDLDRRGEQAIGLVRLIERFNRHVYRTSADDLMANLVELAMRSAPLDFSEFPEGPEGPPLWLHIRERIRPFPFVSELFRRGSLLVQRSHLAGTLLYLATLGLGGEDRAARPVLFGERLTLGKLREKAGEVARLQGVRLHWLPDELPDRSTCLGDEMIWGTILAELARNVYDYGSDRLGVAHTPSFWVVWRSVALAEGGEVWCLAVGGEASFFAKMSSENQQSILESADRAGALISKVKAILAEPGKRYQTESEGSGFGLYFLEKLFNLAGHAHAELLLIRANDALLAELVKMEGERPHVRQPFEDDFAALAEMPLTMVFSWKVERR